MMTETISKRSESVDKITKDRVNSVMIPRPSDMHKGHAGRVLMIAGSKGMAGAAVLAARGALYSGAGLVRIAVPLDMFDILQITVPEAMCIERSRIFASEAKGTKYVHLNEYDAVCIGPGLGENEESARLISKFTTEFEGPLVIDADGINCLARYGGIGLVAEREGVTVLTPHPGEADRLLRVLGCGTYSILGREGTIKALASHLRSIIVLKGSETLTADGMKDAVNGIYVNTTGNPGMATGGSGDVLSGMITSVLAQKTLKADPLERVNACVYIHGLAGDIAASKKGEYGMTAADTANAIPPAIKGITGR